MGERESGTEGLRIFVSYRRDDAPDAAGRLYDRLVGVFGDGVFLDVDDIPPGVDFVEAIDEAVAKCDIFIAVVGKKWLTARDPARRMRRLDMPEDFVRIEIESALRRPRIRVIPLLVQGVRMPSSDELPKSLKKFARRNAVEIRHTSWAADVGSLIRKLEKAQAERPKVTPEKVIAKKPVRVLPRTRDPQAARVRVKPRIRDPQAARPRPPSPVSRTVKGRYQRLAKVGSGEIGTVYRARDTLLMRQVALIVMHPRHAEDKRFVARFQREAQALAALQHPNIVSVYDWGSTGDTYFMVTEFVSGQSLRTLLGESGRLKAPRVIEVALPVLAALEYAHGHGIVHRGLTPENIHITAEGTVKVSDFGLARVFGGSGAGQAEDSAMGTVQYLAPEQIQGEPVDPRTDLYALGVIMFELLTGRPPFSGDSSVGIAYQHVSGRVPAPSTIVPRLPRGLDRVVQHATEKDREMRLASAAAMAEEMQAAM